MTHYDLIVIGTGSGNTVVDDDFADQRVAIIERGLFGGTCLNRGCIPSKMLVFAADAVVAANDAGRLDVDAEARGVAWQALRDRVFERTDETARNGRRYREEQPNVTVYAGTARFVGPHALRVDLESGGTAELSADQIVIATGGRPVLPDIPGLAEADPLTSDTVMRLEELPRRLAIIGGGYVGCELGHVFGSLGVEIVQIESQDRLLAAHDEAIADLYTRRVADRWDLRLATELRAVEPVGQGASRLVLDPPGTGDLVVDAILVVVGRRPNSDLLGLEPGHNDEIGIEVDEQGLIVVDDFQRTTVPGVWALGDASSPEPLKHVANQDARVVRHNLLHPESPIRSDHRHVPEAVFGSPQIAAVGLTETEARERGIDVAVAIQAYADTAYGWALNEPEAGYCAKLIADRSTGRLIGAHLIGPQAATLIQPLIVAVSSERPVSGLAGGQYWIHPAPTEIVENALLDLEQELR